MPNLEGSNRDPHQEDDVLTRVDLNKKASEKERGVLDQEHERWEAFLNTDVGRTCAALADPMIAHGNSQLALSAMAFCKAMGAPLDLLNELRAEIRGELAFWSMIKNRPAHLKARLTEIEGFLGKPDQSPGWQTRKEVEKKP